MIEPPYLMFPIENMKTFMRLEDSQKGILMDSLLLFFIGEETRENEMDRTTLSIFEMMLPAIKKKAISYRDKLAKDDKSKYIRKVGKDNIIQEEIDLIESNKKSQPLAWEVDKQDIHEKDEDGNVIPF